MSPFFVPAFTLPVALIVSYGNNWIARGKTLSPERYKEVRASANLLTTTIVLPLNFLTITAIAYCFWYSDHVVRDDSVLAIMVANGIARFLIGRYGERLPAIGDRLKPILLHNRRVDGLARIEPLPPQIHLDKL